MKSLIAVVLLLFQFEVVIASTIYGIYGSTIRGYDAETGALVSSFGSAGTSLAYRSIVPIPAPILLFGSALTALWVRRKK